MIRIAALAVSALALLGACQQETAAPAAETVRLYAMDCGRINVANAGVFADDGSYEGVTRQLVDPCYLIRHPNGDLLWDAGLPDSLADVPGGQAVEGTPFHVSMPTKLSAQLTQLGLTPSDIEYLSFSHSHFDHVGNAAMFTDAIWIVDEDERAAMFTDEARGQENFPLYAPLESVETRFIEGEADYDVFGDGSVTIVQTPGHTPGHTILRLNLANAGTVLLTGDMWHLAESREARRVPTFNFNRDQTLASMDKVEALAAETNARVVRQHVSEDFAAMPVFPEALD